MNYIVGLKRGLVFNKSNFEGSPSLKAYFESINGVDVREVILDNRMLSIKTSNDLAEVLKNKLTDVCYVEEEVSLDVL